MNQQHLIERGLERLNLTASTELYTKLDLFVEELMKWNKVYNLTAIRERNQIISHHLLDSLAISPYITGSSIIDVGSGGGFPGIPLALYFKDKHFTLLDSNGKKTRFLQQMKIMLNLHNCEIVQGRVREHVAVYDQVTCRAFAALGDICEECVHLLNPGGEVLALKGRVDPDDVSAHYSMFSLAKVQELKVPYIKADRHLVIMKKQSQ